LPSLVIFFDIPFPIVTVFDNFPHSFNLLKATDIEFNDTDEIGKVGFGEIIKTTDIELNDTLIQLHIIFLGRNPEKEYFVCHRND